jgi:hypothetical protein
MESPNHQVLVSFLPNDWGAFYLVSLTRTDQDSAVLRLATVSEEVAEAAARLLDWADDPEMLAQSWRTPESEEMLGTVWLDEPASDDTEESMGQRLLAEFAKRHAGGTVAG